MYSFEIFTSRQGSMRTFSKHYTKCKTVLIKFRKTLQDRRLPILKFSQDDPQINFLNFFTSKNIFITLQYSGDILRIFLKQTFVEYSSNILEALIRDYWNFPKDQHLLLSNHRLLTQKQLLHWGLLKKSFPLKCSLDVPNIATLREHKVNISGILRAGWGIFQRVKGVITRNLLYTTVYMGRIYCKIFTSALVCLLRNRVRDFCLKKPTIINESLVVFFIKRNKTTTPTAKQYFQVTF